MPASQRLTTVPASPIRKLVPYAVAAKKAGVKVYHLNIGDPDIKTPNQMISVLTHWKENPIRYGQSQGEPVLLEAFKEYYQKLGYPFIDTPDIQITTGGSEAISFAMFATCEAGDEIIVFEPFYTNYNIYAAVSDVRLVPVRTYVDNGFHLPGIAKIEKKITKKTKAILYCNPSNPTGTVYTKNEVEMLVKLAKKYNLFLLSDEVYREYVYDGKKQVSILSYMQQIPKLAILLDSLSKRYSLCGARVGSLVSLNRDILAGVLRMAQGRLSVGLIDQLLAAKLTGVPDKYLALVRHEYEKRRDVIYRGIGTIPGVSIFKPEGAFYTVAGLPVSDAEKFCIWLLTTFRDQGETVMLAPAAGFYATPGLGMNEVRIAYVLNTKALGRSVELLAIALEQYNKK